MDDYTINGDDVTGYTVTRNSDGAYIARLSEETAHRLRTNFLYEPEQANDYIWTL
jgi:hypothetical protein